MKTLLLSLLTLVTVPAFANTEAYLKIGTLNVHYTISNPSSESVGDVLYLGGYADRVDNHSPLFSELTDAGLRVIAFDYPSHGKTHGQRKDDLDNHTFSSLAKIGAEVLKAAGSTKPLIIAGWSTGGLLAVRIAQQDSLRLLYPNLAGMILYAPGISVRPCVGKACFITNDTLTKNPQLQDREITPSTPLKRLRFASNLLLNSLKAQRTDFPKDVPTLIFWTSKDDRYINTKVGSRWALKQMNAGAQIIAYTYPNSFHEIDNEIDEHGGRSVRELSAEFAAGLVK